MFWFYRGDMVRLTQTLFRLGLKNVMTVILYRLVIRSGLAEKILPMGKSYEGTLFPIEDLCPAKVPGATGGNFGVEYAEELLEGKIRYFSHLTCDVGSPPAWFGNPFNGKVCDDHWQHWSKLGDFNQAIGDIKVCWELSRFDWALVFARAYCCTEDARFLTALNAWISDWIKHNPVNTGPNWKCGQESSIRLLQVLLAGFLLGHSKNPTNAFVRFVAEHCSRIEPTIRYAIAQDNNHGTSEAAALFVGGAWLEKYSNQSKIKKKGRGWKRKGRKWLEDRVITLVETDGSFSQYSVNYHRLLVDTLNIVEFWRRELGLQMFSQNYQERCQAAVRWLYQMVDESGDVPNLGSNDGARLFVLSDTDYRDFRPTVQLGMSLFLGVRVYPSGPWDETIGWLSSEGDGFPIQEIRRKTREYPKGGYVVFRGEDTAWGVLRYPNFRFRPGHADAFHFDLWHRGVNLLRDSGSFSYNAEEPWLSYFSSTKAHNTVEFDDRDQMPKLSRFLRGCWLQMDKLGELCSGQGKISWSGSYRDYQGARHKRTITNEGRLWTVVDEISGVKSMANLRWRLAPGNWQVQGSRCIGDLAEIQVSSTVPIQRFELQEGWESRFYLQKTRLPVLEIEIGAADTVITSEILIKP